MIIKNITIENFRSYYGVKSMDIGDGLTLIIGANGDGKTTFFEALEWLFDTTVEKYDEKCISKKKAAELEPQESANVRVSMTYINDGSERTVMKSFKFTKNLNGDISVSNYCHDLYIQNGVEKEIKEGYQACRIFDRDFSDSIRKYCLFKGEHDLNIFNKPEAMSVLIETFSQLKNFDPYLSFMSEAKRKAENALDNAIKADKKNSKHAQELRSLIKNEEDTINKDKEDLKSKQSEASKFQSLIEGAEQNHEASSTLVSLNERLKSLTEEREQLQKSIKENYTFRLLDDMWILMGFEPIVEEFRTIVGDLDKEQRKQQSQYDQMKGAEKLANKMKKELERGFVPLALDVPNENVMREMLNDEVCKVCGRPAPKGSEAYNFMKLRLDNFLASQNDVDEEEEIEPLFVNAYIRELTKHYSIVHNQLYFLKNLGKNIDNAISSNTKLHSQINKLSSAIESTEEDKKRLLAQTNGLTEEQLESAFRNITEWWKGRKGAEDVCDMLKRKIEKHSKLLEEYQAEFSKISEASSAALYSRTSTAIRKIFEAFRFAKIKNKRDFLYQLEQEANGYLELLNKGDFRGYARIIEKPDNSAEIVLLDADGERIYNPNTALKTTMYMSLLFAIAKLTTVKHENDFPLIFDAPTSSFTGAKESEFFGVIGNINKQTIIVTKSFLKEEKDGKSILDTMRLKDIKAKKYRISKKYPFDDKNLATIETEIESLN